MTGGLGGLTFVCYLFLIAASLYVSEIVFVFLYFALFEYFLLLVLGCNYQRNQSSGKTRLQNDPLCVKWDTRLLTHSQHYISL